MIYQVSGKAIKEDRDYRTGVFALPRFLLVLLPGAMIALAIQFPCNQMTSITLGPFFFVLLLLFLLILLWFFFRDIPSSSSSSSSSFLSLSLFDVAIVHPEIERECVCVCISVSVCDV